MFDQRFIRALRDSKSWSQSEVAAATGINQPRVSLYERSERQPTRRDYARLERALALGAPREGEAQPVFALAMRLDADGRLQLALSRGSRVGVYGTSESAAAAVKIVRRIHFDKAGKIGVVPVWLAAAFAAVVEIKAAPAKPDDVYLVDNDSESASLVTAVTNHALDVADWLGESRHQAQGNDTAALADAFLERSRKLDAAVL